MNRDYWDEVAGDYERQVLSVFDHDTEGLVCARITAAGVMAPGGTAADLGCGVGKFTAHVANAFVHVWACDSSEQCLTATRARCDGYSNVGFQRFDLTRDPAPFSPVDFALCVNVLIMPSLDERMRAWRAVTNQVVHRGTLLLVVPSLESVQFEHFRNLEARLGEGDSCSEAILNSTPAGMVASEMRQGVHPLEGLPTKHYLREELEQMLPDHEFDVTELIKLEYRAESPTHSVGPWDWLVVARRR